uniref:Helicase C-terminal domain-containing protein n=1 Tax=Heterorhabditis bacteriophora TaxID=37862 RepID=A0A1I7XAV5_HETBA
MYLFTRAEWPLLIVCPASVKSAWGGQISTFIPCIQRIYTIEKGSDPLPEARTSNTVVIMSYDQMVQKHKVLLQSNYYVVIFDESHMLKDVKAKRTQVAHDISKRASRVILLSGTPALSRPAELFSQIRLVNDRLFTNFQQFAIRYCDGRQGRFCFEAHSGSNECLLEYFNLTGIVKAAAVCNHILDNYFYPDAPKRKLLIFGHHQIVLDTIQVEVHKRNLRSIRIDGHTPAKDRGDLCKAFQEDPDILVAVLSMTAAGVGITLTAATIVVFAELHWNPGTLMQAEDRAHRVGQKDCVFVQYLVARNTADDVMWPLIQKKIDVLGQVNLSSDSFRDAEKTHLDCSETPNHDIGQYLGVIADKEMENPPKRAKKK